jgi:general L-amino acid transport system substrate-binding protein
MTFIRFFTALLVTLILAPTMLGATTFETIKQRGWLSCGGSQGLPGFSSIDAKGKWNGIDVDFCRALAAVVLGDPSKVRFTPLSSKERFTALQSGEIDVLSRNTTWTQTRDTALGLNFVGIFYYDGQGLLVPKSLGLKSARELDGATVCLNAGTTTELNLADYFRTHKMRYSPVVFEKSDEVVAAYAAKRCDVYSTDKSGLYAQRMKLKDPDAHMILPEILSKEPLGPVVRQGDDGWFNIVRWTLFAIIGAEELGITSKNVKTLRKAASDPRIRRFVGTEGKAGVNLGLDHAWAVRAVAAAGNYGEMFKRHLGADSRLKIDRGLNRLWSKGGLHYAPPIR